MPHDHSMYVPSEAAIQQLIVDMIGADVRIAVPAAIGDVGGRNGI
jgi:hypothetical protein